MNNIKIPRVIHFIWLGNHRMHPVMWEWVIRWVMFNPHWSVFIWLDDDGSRKLTRLCLSNEAYNLSTCEVFESRNPDLLDRACHLSQRSNIWRYEIVQEYGGLYVDTDIEPVRPIDDLVAESSQFTVSYLREPDHYACSFFGAVPRHAWLDDLVERLPAQDPTISLSMGSAYFTKVTRDHLDVSILPGISVVHDHNPWTQPAGVVPGVDDARRSSNPATYAVHHWSSNWFPKGFEKLGGDK